MQLFWCSVVLAVIAKVSSGQHYGAPGYQPGIPIGTPGRGEVIKANSYEASQSPFPSYGVPPSFVRSVVSSQSYGPPGSRAGRPLSSYGPPGGSRFRIVPATDFKLPEQHSNLIRYIVLKEFQIAPNGSVTPLQTSLGRAAAGGSGSPELEVMKVQMPGSSEGGYSGPNDINSASGVSAKEQSDNSIEGGDEYDDDDYDDDDYDDNSATGGSSDGNTQSQVVPARGVQLMGQTPGTSRQSTDTQAFMFSDPASRETQTPGGSRRQGGGVFSGVRNQLRNTQNRVRNRVQGTRNRNRNRKNRNRNKNNPSAAKPTTVAATSTSGGGGNVASELASAAKEEFPAPSLPGLPGLPPPPPLPVAELQTALQTLSKFFNAQAELMGQSPNPFITAPSSTSGGSSYNNIQGSSGGPYPASSGSGSSSSSGSSSGSGSSDSTASSSGGGSATGGYVGSGQPESMRVADAVVISNDTPPRPTQIAFPASTYGPPPGASGFSGNNPGSAFPNLAEAITQPIQQVVGFKSALFNQVVNGVTAGVRGISAAATAVGNAAGSIGSSSGISNPSPVYGAPESLSPLRAIVSLKGQAVRTVANTGKAGIGIIGAKGQAVANQFGIVTNTLTRGVSESVNNKHNAFQSVVGHIQNIFNTNANIANTNAIRQQYGVV